MYKDSHSVICLSSLSLKLFNFRYRHNFDLRNVFLKYGMFPLNHSVYGNHSCESIIMLHIVLEFLVAFEIHVSISS